MAPGAAIGLLPTMNIQLKYFASVREALGRSHEVVDVPEGIATLGDVRAWLRGRGGVWDETLAEGRALRMAFNHVMTNEDVRLTDGCEVAFFPPVTGG
ncbi:molybdopterin synthase sulfur carrier subunit [Paraburkholderia caribensis]|nr:molybdopterin synthase sulfur carrier subunit [Paraburkholderia caribensis]